MHQNKRTWTHTNTEIIKMLKVMMFRQIENMSIILAMPYWLASEGNVFVTMSDDYALYVPIVFDNY